MRRADLAAVLAVERESYPYPWSRRIFDDCLRVGYCCLVAELDGGVEAHGIMMARAGEAHIMNVCVAPEARRHGLARALLDALLEVARDAEAATVFLEVRPSNEAALELYGSAGFRTVGRRRAYYPAPFGREDALVMARPIRSDPSGSPGTL